MSSPGDVLATAVDEFGVPPHDVDAAVRALCAMPTHWYRIALAGALRPWPERARAEVAAHGRDAGWHPSDTEAIVRVMADEAPLLTVPDGLDPAVADGVRWWPVVGDGVERTVWRGDDGSLVLEVLRSGPSWTCASRVLDPAQRAAFASGGLAALDGLAGHLRDATD